MSNLARTFAAHLDFLKARFRFLPSRESPAPLVLMQSTCGRSKAHHEKPGLFLRFLRSYIDHLFDNFESGNGNYCFGKKSRKSLESCIQKSVRTVCVSLTSCLRQETCFMSPIHFVSHTQLSNFSSLYLACRAGVF